MYKTSITMKFKMYLTYTLYTECMNHKKKSVFLLFTLDSWNYSIVHDSALFFIIPQQISSTT